MSAQVRLTIVPLTLKRASEAVDELHRHHKKPTGHRFSIGVQRPDGVLCGVAIVGRPVARCFDQERCVEVTRVATDGTPNACSALYGAVWGAASRMGFLRAITYTQDGESGASLRAAGWKRVAELRPRTGWDTPSRRREDRGTDGVARILWEQRANGRGRSAADHDPAKRNTKRNSLRGRRLRAPLPAPNRPRTPRPLLLGRLPPPRTPRPSRRLTTSTAAPVACPR